MQVVCNAVGQQTFHETMGIDVEHRCSTDSPDGIPFILLAESCVPGIECNKAESIFEEHAIKKELDPFAPVNNEYGVHDKVLSCPCTFVHAAGAILLQIKTITCSLSGRLPT